MVGGDAVSADSCDHLVMVAFLGLIFSGLALCVALVAVGYTRAQAKEAKRANDLLEAEQKRQSERVESESLANRVRWEVESLANGNFVLRNSGTETAHDVRITSPSIQFLSGPIVDNGFSASGSGMIFVSVVESGGGVKFTATKPNVYTGQGYELIVFWRGASAPRSVPMPAEPRLSSKLG